MAISPVESFEDAAQRFPGIDQLDPQAVGRFVFFSAGNFPEELYTVEAEKRQWQEDTPKSWEDRITSVLGEVKKWQNEKQIGSRTTRYALAKSAEEGVVIGQETEQLATLLGEADPDTGFDSTIAYLEKWGFQVGIDLAPSPMFPEGRHINKAIASFIDREKRICQIPYGKPVFTSDMSGNEGEHLDDRIKQYLDTEHGKLEIRTRLKSAFEALDGVNPEKLAQLREKYGAKAANLIVFKDILENFYGSVENKEGVEKIEIPPFIAIATDMYETWLTKNPDYGVRVETARQAAIDLALEAPGGLVAIRSSAVYSEDGENHTGAGVYKSVVVDPNDSDAFAESIRTVYASTNNPDALEYQASCGVGVERMGLLLQSYIEEDRNRSGEVYGFINSRGANPNIIEVHTPLGTLLFDKPRLQPSLLIDSWLDADDYLHTRPDHSQDLRFMPNRVIPAIHAAIFAELVFRSPIQVEYVSGGQIVQVRPLPKNAFENTAPNISFPEDLEEIVQTKCIGVGDAILPELDNRDDNSEKEGVVIFWSEYGFTDSYNRSHQGLRSLPSKGAVVILKNSNSGHIQTLCQEKGLICFYPNSKSEELDALRGYLDESGSQYYDDNFDTFQEQPPQRRFRLVADGYNGRIYVAE